MSGAPGSSVGKRQGVSMDAAIAAHSAKSRAMFLPSRPQRPPQNHGHTRGGAGGPTAAAAPTVTPTAAPAAATGRSKRVESHEGDRRDGHTEEDHGRRNLIESGLTPAQKLRIRAAFDTFDNDGTGFITAKDLRPVCCCRASFFLRVLLPGAHDVPVNPLPRPLVPITVASVFG
mgnify:CR=1 FL=1